MINLLYVFLFLVLIGAILCNMRICHYFNQQMQTLHWSVNKQKYCNILSIALGTISVILLLPFLFGYSDIWFVCSALGFVALLSVLSYCDYQIFMHNKKHNVWWNKLTYFANFVSNTYDNVNNAYNSVKQDYFGQRNYQNRYKQGCTPSNIAYNTISNYQISPNQKMVI